MMIDEQIEAIKARHQKARDMVNALCQTRGTPGAREWLMSIPARPDVDPDIVISDALGDIPELCAAETEGRALFIEALRDLDEAKAEIALLKRGLDHAAHGYAALLSVGRLHPLRNVPTIEHCLSTLHNIDKLAGTHYKPDWDEGVDKPLSDTGEKD